MREKLIKLLIKPGVTWRPSCLADRRIENGVVIPVRCGECKHRDEDGDICYYHSSFGDDKICYTFPDGYCSDGEPKRKRGMNDK